MDSDRSCKKIIKMQYKRCWKEFCIFRIQYNTDIKQWSRLRCTISFIQRIFLLRTECWIYNLIRRKIIFIKFVTACVLFTRSKQCRYCNLWLCVCLSLGLSFKSKTSFMSMNGFDGHTRNTSNNNNNYNFKKVKKKRTQ